VRNEEIAMLEAIFAEMQKGCVSVAKVKKARAFLLEEIAKLPNGSPLLANLTGNANAFKELLDSIENGDGWEAVERNREKASED